MLKHRVIPCLLLKNGGLVKTRQFAQPTYVGDPINAIRIFNDKEVDELLVLDITAGRERRPPDFELIERFAGECFMPLGYGGGIRTIAQARQLIAGGVEKVCIQTAALEDIDFVGRLAQECGSSSVVVSVDVKRNWRGRPHLYSSQSKRLDPRDWLEFVAQVAEAGAGEVVLNAVDRDGMMNGMDLELIRDAAARISVPLVAIGGAGSLEDLKSAVDAGASAVAAGAFFVFHGPHRAVLITYPGYGALERLFADSAHRL